MTFADCSQMQLTPDLLALCTTVPPDQRPIAQAYIWTSASPLGRFPPPKFSPLPNSLAEQFAIKAIESQPLAYAHVAFDDTWRSFGWSRSVFPNADTYDEYLFGYHSVPISSGHRADGYASSAAAYLDGGNPLTTVVNPFALAIRIYQRYIWLPGAVYGLILLVGLAGIVLCFPARLQRGVTRRLPSSPETGSSVQTAARAFDSRGTGLAALLPWACSVALVVVPAATAEFDYRYVTTAVPFACLALAIAFGRETAGARLAHGLAGRLAGRGHIGAEAGGATGRAGGLPSGSLRGGTAYAGDDQRDFAPDAP